uniref:NADH-ubiquinone oxidoreductase 12 kDa subunit n=1 Tax=Hemiselmis andersenii TaxID=464988 RepID=A0A6U4J2J9_HEMAN|mmetsp:Transcript_4109/g.9756  ORF Transcript_4109/g.9756 Transcript_4109/m.9756 type:complete len:110 (+) Transcript_4109:32-361(+)
MSKNYADPQASANFKIPNSGDPSDPMTTFSKREEENRAGWVKIMKARDIRNQLRDCFRREGVNHVENCREFALAYIQAISEPAHPGGVERIRSGMQERAAAEAAKKDAH